MIANNIKSVRQRISRACEKSGRPADDVRIVCVTKGASVEQAKEALDAGEKILGENRVRDALVKYRVIGDKAEWHLIGHLQTNKVRDAVSCFSLIHAVDSVRLAKEIDCEAKKVNKTQDILIEVNVSGEKTKFGIKPDELEDFLKEIYLYSNINVKGLMTVAPQASDPEKVRPYFRILRELRDKINNSGLTTYNLQLLSMGMTDDFETAVEEGSNMVRIGRAIFSIS